MQCGRTRSPDAELIREHVAFSISVLHIRSAGRLVRIRSSVLWESMSISAREEPFSYTTAYGPLTP
jgi:hypothetical protein